MASCLVNGACFRICDRLVFISKPSPECSRSFLNRTVRTTSYIEKCLHEAICRKENVLQILTYKMKMAS